MDYINIDQKNLRRISLWGRFLGVVTGIAGVTVAIQGLVTTVIGVIPGLVMLLLAHFIFHSGSQAKKFLQSESRNIHALNKLLSNVSYYLIASGIVLIVFIILLFLITE